MTARESFLSFARAAFERRTTFDYPDKTTAVARQDALYTLLMAEPAQVWHLLTWCVVALEEHLSEVPEKARGGHGLSMTSCMSGREARP